MMIIALQFRGGFSYQLCFCVHTHVSVFGVCVFMCVYMFICVYKYIYIHTAVCVHVCVRIMRDFSATP